MAAPSYYITTLGCPKNQADSREMERSLRRRGLRAAGEAAEADIHLINSCSFIESARVETIQTVLEAAGLRRTGGDQKLVLAGCFSERYSSAVRDELPEVDLSFGTGLYHRAGEIIGDHFNLPRPLGGEQAPGAAELLSVSRGPIGPRADSVGPGTYAPVKISDGCNRGCAFCAIPGFRGKFRELPRETIVAECRTLAGEGVREICLVSQDTNQYGGDAAGFLELLEQLQTIDGLAWIRLLYLYPDPRTQQIWEGIVERGLLWSESESGGGKVVPYLESPVQHVSASVLRAMRRFGDYEKFARMFTRLRELVPGLELRTSLLLGFPGETPADIELALRFVEAVRPEKLALFSYSPEEGTPGYSLGDPVSEDEKSQRVNEVRAAHLEVLRELHRERLGQRVRVMLDSVERDGRLLGRRAQDAPEVDEAVFVDVASSDSSAENRFRPGDSVDVELNGFYEYDMTGTLVEDAD